MNKTRKFTLKRKNKCKVNSSSKLISTIAPLFNVESSLQLDLKSQDVNNCMKTLRMELNHHATSRGLLVPSWCNKDNSIYLNDGIVTNYNNSVNIIEIRPIIQINNGDLLNIYSYRNKCEFTIGFSFPKGEKKPSKVAIGFVSNIENRELNVIGIDKISRTENCSNNISKCEYIPIISPCMISVVDCLYEIVTNASNNLGLEVYSRRNRKGIWRLLIIRTTEIPNKRMMVIIQTSYLSISDYNTISKLLIKQLVFRGLEESFLYSDYQISSLYLQQSDSIVDTFEGGNLKLIWGDEQITYCISNTTLNIGPRAFFQTNTQGCQILYSTIKDLVISIFLSNSNKKKLIKERYKNKLYILDICCGVGSIGLYLYKSLETLKIFYSSINLIGVDCVEEAISVARMNAKINGAENTEYIVGKAEDILPNKLLSIRNEDADFLAIVDPPRCGLHKNVTKALRNSSNICSLIYVSCNTKSLLNNCITLCSAYDPQNEDSIIKPFIPKLVIPIDIFPYTNHVETVVYLERDQESIDLNSEIKGKMTTINPLLQNR
ncbi:hypothetical protein ACR3K2_29740 [Cryptosporidium serpentis]